MLSAFHGLCMALADSVPGVSGGTIAFILGFYDDLLRALQGLFNGKGPVRRQSLRALLQLRRRLGRRNGCLYSGAGGII